MSGPSQTSINEYNKISISRRSPARARWTECCISEIRPGLRLISGGVMEISVLMVTRRTGIISDRFTLTWEKARDTYTVWMQTNGPPQPLVYISLEDWESLGDIPGDGGGGVIRAKLNTGSMLPSHNDLVVLDATKPSLQIISTSFEGHRMMDMLVSALLTVGVVHTRMAKQGRAANVRTRIPAQGLNKMY